MSPLVEELLTEIGGVGALNIPCIGTADLDWNCRVVYSVLGKMALASLYEDRKSVV